MMDYTGQNKVATFKTVVLVLATLISSFISANLIFRSEFTYEMPEEFAEMPMSPSAELMARYKIAFRELLSSNYALQFAIFGTMMGLAVGAIGSISNRPSALASSVVGGAIGGTVLAAAGGCLLGWFAFLGMEINWETIRFIGVETDPFLQTTLLQCFVWMCIGLGIGLGCTLASMSFAHIAKGIGGGLLGGAFAGVSYSLVAAIFFSSSSAVDFVPKELSERVVWALVTGLCTFCGLVFVLRKSQVKDAQASDQNAHLDDAEPEES